MTGAAWCWCELHSAPAAAVIDPAVVGHTPIGGLGCHAEILVDGVHEAGHPTHAGGREREVRIGIQNFRGVIGIGGRTAREGEILRVRRTRTTDIGDVVIVVGLELDFRLGQGGRGVGNGTTNHVVAVGGDGNGSQDGDDDDGDQDLDQGEAGVTFHDVLLVTVERKVLCNPTVHQVLLRVNSITHYDV